MIAENRASSRVILWAFDEKLLIEQVECCREDAGGGADVEAAECLGGLALIAYWDGEQARAIESYGRQLEILERHYGEDHFELIYPKNRLAQIYAESGNHSKGEEILRESLEMAKAWFDEKERQRSRRRAAN